MILTVQRIYRSAEQYGATWHRANGTQKVMKEKVLPLDEIGAHDAAKNDARRLSRVEGGNLPVEFSKQYT
jgi:hypothetical protein